MRHGREPVFLSLFCCPHCSAPLVREEGGYLCPRGHRFDLAREGYVHLLPANRMHSKQPGDNREMAAARNRFLSGGHYCHLRDLLCQLALEHTGPAPSVLDAGCGEGYYTAGLYEALQAAGRTPRVAGVDLSKPSLRCAARRAPAGEFAVASVYHLPLADGAADLVLDCFSPLAAEEFWRVLRPGGIFLYVVPAARHLWQLKQVLYDAPYLNAEEEIPYSGFLPLGVAAAERTLCLVGKEVIGDLFRMTPYYWKTPKEGTERLAGRNELAVEAAFRVHLFQKTP